MKNLLIAISLSFSFFLADIVQAQENWEQQEKRYTDNFNLARESVFLHLNKTSVAPGEDLWIAAYVYDPRLHMPNQETMNLDVEIHDEKGNHLETKTVYISHGKGAAFIALDPKKFIPGKYFLKASTNYMNNFEEDLSYTQSFEVLGKQYPAGKEEESFDLQLLPEGGHLLSGALNSVGVRLINSKGDGVAFDDAVLLDETKAEVTTLKSNEFGISRFFMVPEAEKEYTLRLRTRQGQEVEKKLERASKTGLSLISTPRINHYLLTIRTNTGTRANLENENFLLAIHRDGKIKTLDFTFPAEKLETNIRIPIDSLFPGVNTLTVFDGKLQPRLERLIFNEKGLKRAGIAGRMTANQGDSLVLQVTSTPPTQNASLSVSVLPSETLAYNPNHSIFSAFWLKPYVKGTIDRAEYYFSGAKTNRKNHELDLLLLTQGWRKYNWQHRRRNKPEETFEHHRGFNIAGRVESRRGRNEKTLLIRSDHGSGLFEIVPVNDDNSFRLENVYLADSTALSFSLINEKNKKMSKPSVHLSIHPLKNEENLNHTPQFPELKIPGSTQTELPEGFIGEAVLLDTVMLSTKIKVDEKYGGDIPLIEQKVEITEEIENMYPYIKDYIATQGFRVQDVHAGGTQINSRYRSTFWNDDMRPLFYFNGARVGKELPLLSTLRSSEVESITISRRGNGEGMDGVNGVIKINTKKGGTTTGDTKENVVTRIITGNGFTENKEFYAPKYSSYSHSAFRNYGAIDWKPNLFLDSSGKAEFKVLNVLHPEIKLYIEGMTAGGILFSEVLTVKTN